LSDAPAIKVQALSKTFRTPFRRKRVDVLREVSFEVQRGEIFGFLGPNGAGKTTTIRILMGVIAGTGGSADILGHRIPSRQARRQVGFLPEHPYFYDYLTVSELLDLVGRLHGLDKATRRERAKALIARVGLERAANLHLKKYSKGMLQRAGLAQALMNDPALVVLDEPMSGLDPVGRKEVRDLILELRDQGKTVFFSTHILSDVEAIADRVAIVVRGRVQTVGVPRDLVSAAVQRVDLVLRLPADAPEAALAELTAGASRVRRREDELMLAVPGDADVDALLATARSHGVRVVSVTPQHETLEDIFLRQVEAAGGGHGVGAAQ
jgi:ABC-2 type transport system ATP-binding protein